MALTKFAYIEFFLPMHFCCSYYYHLFRFCVCVLHVNLTIFVSFEGIVLALYIKSARALFLAASMLLCLTKNTIFVCSFYSSFGRSFVRTLMALLLLHTRCLHLMHSYCNWYTVGYVNEGEREAHSSLIATPLWSNNVCRFGDTQQIRRASFGLSQCFTFCIFIRLNHETIEENESLLLPRFNLRDAKTMPLTFTE